MKKAVLTAVLFICSGLLLVEPLPPLTESRDLSPASAPQLNRFQNMDENPITNIIDPELYRKTEKSIPALNNREKIIWSFRTAKSHPFI
jgi:hypothetical protein